MKKVVNLGLQAGALAIATLPLTGQAAPVPSVPLASPVPSVRVDQYRHEGGPTDLLAQLRESGGRLDVHLPGALPIGEAAAAQRPGTAAARAPVHPTLRTVLGGRSPKVFVDAKRDLVVIAAGSGPLVVGKLSERRARGYLSGGYAGNGGGGPFVGRYEELDVESRGDRLHLTNRRGGHAELAVVTGAQEAAILRSLRVENADERRPLALGRLPDGPDWPSGSSLYLDQDQLEVSEPDHRLYLGVPGQMRRLEVSHPTYPGGAVQLATSLGTVTFSGREGELRAPGRLVRFDVSRPDAAAVKALGLALGQTDFRPPDLGAVSPERARAFEALAHLDGVVLDHIFLAGIRASEPLTRSSVSTQPSRDGRASEDRLDFKIDSSSFAFIRSGDTLSWQGSGGSYTRVSEDGPTTQALFEMLSALKPGATGADLRDGLRAVTGR